MQHAITAALNRTILAALIALHLLVLFALPLLLHMSPWWGLVLLPFIWLTIVHWGLIHEAIHKLLFPNASTNEYGGRLLAIMLGTSFHVLRFGHLMHHKLNRNFHSEAATLPTWGGRIGYYFHLLFGLYLSEVATGLCLLLLPRRHFMAFARATLVKGYEEVAIAGERFFYDRGYIRQIRTDMMLCVALYASAAAFYGTQWPWLLAFIGVRALVVSFMDNIYHFGTPADNSMAAKELALPEALSAMILYGNYHETHHTNPTVPWHALPIMHEQQRRGFAGPFLAHGLMQFGGPFPA